MNFLGIGPFEFLVVAALAFFLLGPEKMASAGKTIGKTLRDLRRQRDDLTAMIMQEVEDAGDRKTVPPRPEGSVIRPAVDGPSRSSSRKPPPHRGGDPE